MGERIHGVSAAGAGHLGVIEIGETLGPCPSCAAPISIAIATDPHTKKAVRSMVHPMPFCTYFGETSPHEIENEIERLRAEIS